MKTFREFLLENKTTPLEENSLENLFKKYFKNVELENEENGEYSLCDYSRYIKVPSKYRKEMDWSTNSVDFIYAFVVNENGKFEFSSSVEDEDGDHIDDLSYVIDDTFEITGKFKDLNDLEKHIKSFKTEVDKQFQKVKTEVKR